MDKVGSFKESVKSYVASRDAFAQRMARVSRQLNEWTEMHSTVPPSLTDIAHFEGLRAERSRLLAEFGDREERFVVELLEGLSASREDMAKGSSV